jgi:catechol 2,3-dioxygenase-like lactoylglutathione lyase family enzyme
MRPAPRLWVGTIVIDCTRFDEMLAFWRAALGYEQSGPRDPGWTRLDDPTGVGPNLAFRADPEAPGRSWWYHLDLFSTDPAQDVERLVRLGARIEEAARPDRDFVTLLDPDGNPFDVITEPRVPRASGSPADRPS